MSQLQQQHQQHHFDQSPLPPPQINCFYDDDTDDTKFSNVTDDYDDISDIWQCEIEECEEFCEVSRL